MKKVELTRSPIPEGRVLLLRLRMAWFISWAEWEILLPLMLRLVLRSGKGIFKRILMRGFLFGDFPLIHWWSAILCTVSSVERGVLRWHLMP